jgi:hypothetical protein
VPVPSQESERVCICVLGVSIFFLRVWYLTLELFRLWYSFAFHVIYSLLYWLLNGEAVNDNFIILVWLTGAWTHDPPHSRRACEPLHYRCSMPIRFNSTKTIKSNEITKERTIKNK